MDNHSSLFDLHNFIIFLLDRKKKIILFSFAYLIISIIVSLLLPNWYTSTVKILPSKSNSNILGQYSNLASMFGVDLGGIGAGAQNVYPSIVLSDYMLEKILNTKFKTKTGKELSLYDFWDNKIDNTDELEVRKRLEKGKKKLRESYISSEIDLKTDIVEISVSVPKDPVLASSITNYIIKQLDYYNKNVRKNKATEQRQFIEKRLSAVKNELDRAQKNKEQFLIKNPSVNTPQLKTKLQKLSLEEELQKQLFIELRKKLEIVKIEELNQTETLNIINKAPIPYFKSKPKRSVLVIIMTFFLVILTVSIMIFNHSVVLPLKEKN